MSKGRDQSLINKRNEALLRRYYYWTEVQRLRFDDTLKVLSEQEFFISEERILRIIRQSCRNRKEVMAIQIPKVRIPKLTIKQLTLFENS